MKAVLAGIVLVAFPLTLFPLAAQPLPPKQADAALVAKCQACHGKNGDSADGTVPRLNGQRAEYLAARLRSFADLTQQSPHAIYAMTDVNAGLSDAEVAALARYFSGQMPTPRTGTFSHAPAGQKLYRAGGCQQCHGADGEGSGHGPRLAGQHIVYLRAQLSDFSMMTRLHPGMNAQTRMLSAPQIAALAAWLGQD